MLRITSEEFQRNTGSYQDLAYKESVMICNHKGKRLVLMNADEYRQLKKRARIILRTEELTNGDIAHIESTTMSGK